MNAELEVTPAVAAPRHRLLATVDGTPRCTGCGACSDVCPTQCIAMVVQPPSVASFRIDTAACIFCHQCVVACPEDALRLDTGVPAAATYNRADGVVERTELMAACGRPGARAPRGAQNAQRRVGRGR